MGIPEIGNEKLLEKSSRVFFPSSFCIVLEVLSSISLLRQQQGNPGVGWWDLTKGKIEEEVNGARK